MADPTTPAPPVVSTELALASLIASLVAGTPTGVQNAEKYCMAWYKATGKKLLTDTNQAERKAIADAQTAAENKAAADAKAAGDAAIAKAAQETTAKKAAADAAAAKAAAPPPAPIPPPSPAPPLAA
jgi:hypothetical protein